MNNDSARLQIKYSIVCVTLLALFVIAYYMLLHSIPKIVDDYVYSRSFYGATCMADDTDPNRMINSLGEFVRSVSAHFTGINDRFVVVVAEQLLCITHKCIADILYAILMPLMLFLASWQCNTHQSVHTTVRNMCLAAFLIFFFNAYPCMFYEGVVYPINHLLPPIAFFLLVFGIRHYRQHLCEGNNGITALLCAVAVAGAWCHESYSMPVAAAMALWLVIRYKSIPSRIRIIMICYIIATAIMVFAPANLQRYTMEATRNCDVSGGVSPVVYHLRVLRYMRITYVLAVVLLCMTVKDRCRTVDCVRTNAFLVTCIVASVMVNIAIGGVNPRVVWATEMFSLALLLQLLRSSATYRKYDTGMSFVGICVTIALMVTLIHAEKPYVETLKKVDNEVRLSDDDVCIIQCEAQDTLPSQMQKYIVATLNPYQKDVIRWIYAKKKVEVRR